MISLENLKLELPYITKRFDVNSFFRNKEGNSLLWVEIYNRGEKSMRDLGFEPRFKAHAIILDLNIKFANNQFAAHGYYISDRKELWTVTALLEQANIRFLIQIDQVF